MKSKLISRATKEGFETDLNEYLRTIKQEDLIDIKFSVTSPDNNVAYCAIVITKK
jgi:hypothetical protein